MKVVLQAARRMQLEHIRLFLEIVARGSLAAAARAKGISSTTVSERLAVLETYPCQPYEPTVVLTSPIPVAHTARHRTPRSDRISWLYVVHRIATMVTTRRPDEATS